MKTFKEIEALQKQYGFARIQEQINNGRVWHLEGAVGRYAMSLLTSGVCMLPKKFHRDSYGNQVPSRDVLKQGTKGTFQNCAKFWKGVEEGSIYLEKEAEVWS